MPEMDQDPTVRTGPRVACVYKSITSCGIGVEAGQDARKSESGRVGVEPESGIHSKAKSGAESSRPSERGPI